MKPWLRAFAALCEAAPAGHRDALRADASEGDPGFAPHWREFFEAAAVLGEGQVIADSESFIARMDELAQVLQRKLDDNGVTYNLYSDDASQARPWSLDLLPQIITTADWRVIESGVLQRTRLLNAILSDVYGPQALIRESYLPMALVQGSPFYLRSAHGIRPSGGTYLHIAAFDLACGPDGRWWIMSQRLQAPSGLGYLLENRMLVSRLFPDAFRSLRVERVVGAYKTLLANLKSHARRSGEARIVLLTSGPYNETYFEHVYLARYLGIPLVEGGDLVTRDERVWLKTLTGLEQVDVILRRIDDDFLDPLELRADSALGIPGLLQAWRAGHIVMANAPGCGFLESTAVLAFLPAIAKRLLGEELLLPSIATWWCGERSAIQAMLPQLEHLVIKPTYSDPARRFVPTLGHELSEQERSQWIERIQAQPENYTTQAFLPLMHAPSWRGAGAQAAQVVAARASMVRVFAIADGPGRWRVLPGGLARIAPHGKAIVSMYRGGSSADVWALTGRVAEDANPLTLTWTPLGAGAQLGSIPSRAAENLFWFGRYTERLENTVRSARIVLEALTSNDEGLPSTQAWLARLALANGLVGPGTPMMADDPDGFERALLERLRETSSQQGGMSVAATLRALKAAAFSVRERLALEQWSLVEASTTEFEVVMRGSGRDERLQAQRALRALERLAIHAMAMTGAQIDRMTRDDGWRLLSVGRQIERLYTLAEALAEAFDTGMLQTDTGFGLALALFDSTITYRSRYLQERDPWALVQLLVLDIENPRALAWVARTLESRLERLPHAEEALRAWHGSAELPHRWSRERLEKAVSQASQGHPQAILNMLRGAVQAAAALSDTVSQRYFSHAAASRAIGG